MRRNAGSFVRTKALVKSFLILIGLGIMFGLLLANLFLLVVTPWIGNGWTMIVFLAVAGTITAVAWFLVETSHEWSVDRLWRGGDAETRVGQAIEYAIASGKCGVAHSVTEIAKHGDIDHIVATPVAIWVVETKFKRVHSRKFPEVLGRLAANTKAVREWAPGGTPVRGALVLAFESKIRRKNFAHGTEKIVAYTPEQLMRELRGEAREKRSIDRSIARRIWKLGRIEE